MIRQHRTPSTGAGGPPQHPDVLTHERASRAQRGTRYQFVVAERLADETLGDFPELTEAAAQAGRGGTVLFGPVSDRRHLYELLHRFNVSGLTVVDLRVLPD